MNILVTLDRNYLPPLRVMLGSLLRNDPGETFEIYAIGDGLLPEDWTALEELCAGRGHIHPLEVPADLFADAPVARYWTRAMYYRLLAMFDGRTNLALQVAEEVKHYFPGKVYATVIPRNVRLSEAPSHGKPITAYDRTSRGAEAYTAFAAEFLKKQSA